MSVYQKLVNLDEVFHSLNSRPNSFILILNDTQKQSEEERKALKRMLYTTYETTTLNTIARCNCGNTSGEYNVGVICPECKTRVEKMIHQDLEPIVWVRAPHGVKHLVNPYVWYLLNKIYRIGKLSLIEWFCDPLKKPDRNSATLSNFIMLLKQANIERGYNNFIDNFDKVIGILGNMKDFNRRGKNVLTKVIDSMTFMKIFGIGQTEITDPEVLWNRKCMFCDYIPMPNKVLLVLENTNLGKYIDDRIMLIINAMMSITSIDVITPDKGQKSKTISIDQINYNDDGDDDQKTIDDRPIREKERRTTHMLCRLAEAYEAYIKERFASKQGLVRKHIVASRANFSCRAVITSITEAHDYDEIHIPWKTAVGVLRYHILNKLLKKGMLANEALNFINKYTRQYHPMLDEIFKTLIKEAVHKNQETGQMVTGIPALLNRNPSLGRGSIIRVRITKILTNPNELAFRMSILAVRSLNADFDGDALHVMLLLDDDMVQKTATLQGHYNVWDMSKPRNSSDAMSIPKPVVANINRYFHGAPTQGDPRLMEQYAC